MNPHGQFKPGLIQIKYETGTISSQELSWVLESLEKLYCVKHSEKYKIYIICGQIGLDDVYLIFYCQIWFELFNVKLSNTN